MRIYSYSFKYSVYYLRSNIDISSLKNILTGLRCLRYGLGSINNASIRLLILPWRRIGRSGQIKAAPGSDFGRKDCGDSPSWSRSFRMSRVPASGVHDFVVMVPGLRSPMRRPLVGDSQVWARSTGLDACPHAQHGHGQPPSGAAQIAGTGPEIDR